MALLPPPTRLAALAACLCLAACSKAPAEPDAPPAVSATPAVTPLVWDAPGSWTRLPSPPRGPLKAAYKIDKVGDDKDEAELDVFFFGTGAAGDPAKVFQEWFRGFDGDVGPTAARGELTIKDFQVETVEVTGTYKIGLTPVGRGFRRSPVQSVKPGFRMHGAVVKTKDRGRWFFRLVGPDETVQSAKSAFRGLLETLR